jgi:hypothetical protein
LISIGPEHMRCGDRDMKSDRIESLAPPTR